MNNKPYIITIPGGLSATYILVLCSWLQDWNMLPLGIAALTFSIALLFIFILTYHMWRSIYTGKPGSIHPVAAVLYSFIPGFNVYWLFQSIWGWAKRYNHFIAERHQAAPPVPERIYLAYVILWFLSAIPFVSIVTVPIAIILVWTIVHTSIDAINAIQPKNKEGQ